MSELEIKNFEDFIRQNIDTDKIIKDYQLTRLTAPGENYGSLMLKVDITLESSNKTIEKLHAVAKLIPEDPFFRKIFQIEETVKKEIAFYSIIVPTLRNFQRERGEENVIDFFPKLYGSRFNLTANSEEIDEDALLLFENLNIKGFRNIDRHVGFDLDTAKIVIKDLATFHAVSLALKIQKPQVFEERIKSYCKKMKPPSSPPPNPNEKQNREILLEICENNEESKPYRNNLEELLIQMEEKPELLFNRPDSPNDKYSTISHGDMWVNNTMQRLEDDKVVENKLVDFQSYYYDSATKDLHFFLWSSCQISVLRSHINDLIKFYYDNFISNLATLDCDISSFTFDDFMKEMKNTAEEEFLHCFFFIVFVVFGKKHDAAAKKETNDPQFLIIKKEDVSQELRDKVAYLIHYFGKNGWITIK